MIRVQLTISGKVQNVFFRVNAQQKAQQLFIKGWVANNADGTVTIVAEGAENQINDFIDWCHSGPSTAHVQTVHVDPIPT
ncbi:acylphosphatase [Candidatus Peregrinibacteria bacterium]|nr:MAG: acylphosphatase [Candidatus Peregrinibacteria bacterium]